MKAFWLQMIDLNFFQYLKGRCHGNQFSGKNWAKLPTSPALDAMLSAVHAVVVCLFVRLFVCVCLSHSGIVRKRLNVGSRK